MPALKNTPCPYSFHEYFSSQTRPSQLIHNKISKFKDELAQGC